jgi:hypothetical protein
VVAASISAAAPAGALATGGGSAGDQQYIDPLAGLHSHAHKPTTSTPSPPSPSPSTGAASGTSNTTSGAQVAGTTTSSTNDPTATTATTASGGRKLPFTGFDPLPGVAAGATLIAGGLVLRRKARSA